MTRNVQLSQDEFVRLLRRAGYEPELIQEIVAQLSDPIDVDRDAPILDRYGLNRERLMDRLGGLL
jgi:hypothetical protein